MAADMTDKTMQHTNDRFQRGRKAGYGKSRVIAAGFALMLGAAGYLAHDHLTPSAGYHAAETGLNLNAGQAWTTREVASVGPIDLGTGAPLQTRKPDPDPVDGVKVAQVGAGGTIQPSNVRATHGAWSIVCDLPPGATNEQCVLMQNVVAADREEFGLSVVVLKTADKKARILRVLAPLGVLLPNGLGLNIDGNDIGRAYFVRCFTDGCYAEVILEDTLIKALSEGNSATFYVFQTPEEGIGIPVDLTGFTEGYRALP